MKFRTTKNYLIEGELIKKGTIIKTEDLDMNSIICSHRLEEMARLGYFSGYEIMVFENEGSIPHFHFKNIQNNNMGCIKLLTCEYFDHSEYKARLNAKERKELVKFLSSKPKEQYFRDGLNNYDVLCLLWDMNNNSKICNKVPIMPDYTKLR